MHAVAIYLHALRQQQPGLTQQRAGALIGVDKKTVERWERGDHEPPLTRLRDYVDALGGSIDYAVDLLLDRQAQPVEPPGAVIARQRLSSLPCELITALDPIVSALLRERD